MENKLLIYMPTNDVHSLRENKKAKRKHRLFVRC